MADKDISTIIMESRMTEQMRKVQDLIYADIEKVLSERKKQIDAALECACRYLVSPPIKGEITRGKIRWRGLRLKEHLPVIKMGKDGDKVTICYEQDFELWQRDKRIL